MQNSLSEDLDSCADLNGKPVSLVSMFNTRFFRGDEPSEPIYCKIEFADFKIGKDRPCELLSAQSHFNLPIFDNSSFFFRHFGNFDSDVSSLHSEKVVFCGTDRFVFHIFHPKKVFKNENSFCFLKVQKLSFLTVPLRASNSQWSPRTVKNKNKL